MEIQWYHILLIVLGVTAVPFFLGERLGRALRMPDHGWKLGLIFVALASSITITIVGWPPKLGIDLSGGVILVYEIDEEGTSDLEDADAGTAGPGIDIGALVTALKERIDPSNVRELVVRPYGDRQVEIIIPDADKSEIDEIKRRIVTSGFLEFRIVATEQRHRSLIDRARAQLDEARAQGRPDPKWVVDEQGERIGVWVAVGRVPEDQRRPGEDEYRVSGFPERIVRFNRAGDKEVLMVVEQDVQGKDLRRANAGFDERARPAVHFTMTNRGAALLRNLTASYLPDKQANIYYQLGIVMDNQLLSAPRIMSVISDNGQITGDFTQREVEFLVAILQAGRLPAVLREEPISESAVSAMLGVDTIRKGRVAITVSLIAVLCFMLVYYRFSGIIACFALVTNLLMILAMMILIKAAFTLPGLAGLVLTVGMAVDANILIYERIREELNRGATLRMALRNGFSRATTTIVDANLTTLITGVVLYAIGTDQIRGFAVTLILGILISMFTAIFCARVIFDIAERRRWISQLNMMRILGETHFDFLGKRWIAITASLVLIGVGILAVVIRGKDIFDIDFNGGTSVTVYLEQPMDIEEVRRLVSSELPDVSVTTVDLAREGEDTRDRVFKIDTSLTGFGELGLIRVTDRAGNSGTVDLAGLETRDAIIQALNRAFRAQGLRLEAEINEKKDGFAIKDISGIAEGQLIVESADDTQTAELFGIAYRGPADRVDSGKLPGSVEMVEMRLKQLFQRANIALVTHDMKFSEPQWLESAQLQGSRRAAAPGRLAGYLGSSALLVGQADGAVDEPADETPAEAADPDSPAPADEPSPAETEGEETAEEDAPAATEPPTDDDLMVDDAADEPADEADAAGEAPAAEPLATDQPAEEAPPVDDAPAEPAPAEQPEVQPAEEPEAPAAAEEQPAAPAEGEPAEAPQPSPEVEPPMETLAEEEPLPLEPPAEAAPPDAEPSAPAEPPAEEPPVTPQPPADEAPTPPAAPGRLLSQSILEFDELVNAEDLMQRIRRAAASLGIRELEEGEVFVDAEGWDRRSSRGFSTWTVQLATTPEEARRILEVVEREFDAAPVWPSSNRIGSAVAGKMQRTAISALLVSLVFIVGYIWIRFQKVVFGLAAVVALVHDVAITVGAIAMSYWLKDYLGFLLIEDFKISLPVVAALLTIIGYSLNDTIVIFDRIREVRGKSPELTVEMVNRSINQTLARTLLTSLTTLIVVGILYTIGGAGIHTFAFCLVVGVITGTYSTVFIASPFLLWMSGSTKRQAAAKAAALVE